MKNSKSYKKKQKKTENTIINHYELTSNKLEKIKLSATQKKICKEILRKIDGYAHLVEKNIEQNPQGFNYESALGELSEKKYEIALEVRKYVE